MKKKIYAAAAFALISMTVLVSESIAQPPPPSGPPCWPPPCIPVDGGISLLIIAGAAYGGKKLYDSSKMSAAGKAE